MAQKVVEFYIETLKNYTKKLNKDKVTLLMQVGEFFEIYGLIYPDGRKEGNIWEVCDNLNLKIGDKKQEVYGDPSIQVVMGGVGESYINPYIQKAVDRFGWTVVIFEQSKVGNTSKFERKEASIISPGININSDSNNISNITMIIYIEQVKKYYTSNSNSASSNTNIFNSKTNNNNNKYNNNNNNNNNNCQVNIGVAFVDCLTGANGVISINNSAKSDISIPLDELLKLLTIKNPKELLIYINTPIQTLPNTPNTPSTQATPPEVKDDDIFSDNNLVNALHLFNYQFKIIRDVIDEKFDNSFYQSKILETVYKNHKGILDITQQLDIDGAQHNYSRIALTMLLEFILNHDKSIITKLEKPEIMLNSDKYLMLANNCLEQLDIIDNIKDNESKHLSAKRISLLELLDNTKTPLGKILLRQRLSIPITDCQILEERYKTIGDLETLHNNYIVGIVGNVGNGGNGGNGSISNSNSNSNGGNGGSDKYGSPLHQLRLKLSGIKNIDNYLRKIITHKIQPSDIGSYVESLSKCIKVYDFISSLTNTNNTNTTHKSAYLYTHLNSLLPNDSIYNTITTLYNSFISDIKLELLQNAYIWNSIESNPFTKGVSPKLDELQLEIDDDRSFLDNLIIELSKAIDPKFNPSISKPIIFVGENASKGIHIFTNKQKKDVLEAYFNKKDSFIKICNYRLTLKEIKFTQLKESRWEIEIVYLKTSNGTLRVNIEKMGKLVKNEVVEWLHKNIISNLECLDALSRISRFIGELDILQSNVINAIDNGYTRPNIDMNADHSYVKAELLRHPIIEHITKTSKYIPNDVSMGIDGVNGILLFGVNAVGKSSLMKSIGINIIMAQAGMYVASSKFSYKPYKYLFTRIRNNDNLYAGLSSFEVEMKEFKVILRYANEDSIILGDELASGTETQDATALVASGIGLLSKRNCSFIFATHLHFLADMNYITDLTNVKLCHMAVELDPKDSKKLIYSRKIHNGSGPKSYGIMVCEAMDLDEDFIVKAKEIRASMNVKASITDNIVTNSKYNSDKIVNICEVCNDSTATDVHHINQQCDANQNNLIVNSEIGIFNKNKLWNLVALCKDCHKSVHSVPQRLDISGYISTSLGIELKYNWINCSVSNSGCNSNSNSNGNSNINVNTNQKNDMNDMNIHDIHEKIKEMKKINNTPKKIQYDLKRNFNISMTQQEIRECC
jgi:DNA mismatch repair protein MutS